MTEHFAGPPDWTWYILVYFFFAGLSGGSYVIASLFRLRGDASDEPAARLGYYVSFAALLPCPVMLILDLGRPLRFWHMMWNTSPDAGGINFVYWSPMSVGVWALLIFSVFVTVSFAEALVRDGKLRIAPVRWVVGLLGGTAGKVFITLGAAFGLFIAGYTGVLLSVTNQPVWSDTWTLGGLFLASGLSGSAALLLLLTRYRREAQASAGMLTISERLYALLELVLIVIFALSMILAGAFDEAFGFPWTLLWLVALIGLAPGIGGLLTSRLAVTGEGAVVAVPAKSALAMPGLVLIGVLALRASVIFPIQI
jgi:polysulfide reductase chain C